MLSLAATCTRRCPNVHWLSMMRTRFFIRDSTRTASLAMLIGRGVPRLFLPQNQIASDFAGATLRHSAYRAGRCELPEMQYLMPSAPSDHDQNVVRVAHQGCTQRQRTAQYLVVRDDPQVRTQHRAERRTRRAAFPPLSCWRTLPTCRRGRRDSAERGILAFGNGCFPWRKFYTVPGHPQGHRGWGYAQPAHKAPSTLLPELAKPGRGCRMSQVERDIF